MKYFIDDGYVSLNHVGEELCGDKVEIIRNEEGTTFVLADGLGSGVKANILSTLTSKMLCLMAANGVPIEECIESIIKSLPVCSVRKVAYSTFTIIHIDKNGVGYIFEYDNPPLYCLRNGKVLPIEKEKRIIEGKTVYCSKINAELNDMFIFMSDGAPHAGIGKTMTLGWSIEDIMKYTEDIYDKKYPAREFASIIADTCKSLYLDEPGDDTTICCLKVVEPLTVNILVGPPADIRNDDTVVEGFMKCEGVKIVCGGTTSKIVSKFLGNPIKVGLDYVSDDVPPIAYIDGIDLVTEGVITLGKVLELAEKYKAIDDVDKTMDGKDGASKLADIILKRASNVNLFVGTMFNTAHNNLSIDYAMKMKIVEKIKVDLEEMGKCVTISYH